jgi:small subunit ribosomal protein S17
MEDRNNRKEKIGFVVSDKMDKTVTVEIERKTQHPLYKRVINQTKLYKVHDENNECNEGDKVRIMETRPLSKTKRWRVVEIIEKAK